MSAKPWKVGWTESSHKFGKERVRMHQARLSAATTLRDLADQYVFYTPALLHMIVPLMGRDPFAVFLQEYGKEVLPLSLKLSRPIFQGLNLGQVEDWNYLLFAMEREHFQPYLRWMQSLTFNDPAQKRIYRLGDRVIRIADPLFFEKAVILPKEIPCIDVTVFCIDGSAGCYYLEEGDHPLLDLPRLRTAKPFEDTQKLAKALLAGWSKPFEAIEQAEQDVIQRVREARQSQGEA